MSIENIAGMMFEYSRQYPNILSLETVTMSVKVVHIGLKARRRSINKEWGICTRWE
ncbi:hypothetical protein AGMMS49990_04920 [Endomicrobiia bacterium]|nr:hypothetical protein AGMMS49990_04920 [Endomicrobiia bacterium]